MSTQAALETEELSTDYGPVRAVDGVTLAVNEGSITAVLGANGAGKTSLLRTIAGLQPASAGRVRLAGQDILGVAVEDLVRRGLAQVPEGRGVITELTTEENLRLGGLWRGADGADLEEMYELFPPLRERRMQARRLALGRRAPDALDRPRADGQAAGAAARRALARARADRQRADHAADSRARHRARPGGPAGRAERAQRTVDRRPRRSCSTSAAWSLTTAPARSPPTRTSATPTWGSER